MDVLTSYNGFVVLQEILIGPKVSIYSTLLSLQEHPSILVMLKIDTFLVLFNIPQLSTMHCELAFLSKVCVERNSRDGR